MMIANEFHLIPTNIIFCCSQLGVITGVSDHVTAGIINPVADISTLVLWYLLFEKFLENETAISHAIRYFFII